MCLNIQPVSNVKRSPVCHPALRPTYTVFAFVVTCLWRSGPCSRGSVRSPGGSTGDEQDDTARLEAERKLEELKRRRDDAESEEFERMRQKQQEAEVELEELKRKREERRKVLEEEERQKKQEEAERKAREEVEKRERGVLMMSVTLWMLFDQFSVFLFSPFSIPALPLVSS